MTTASGGESGRLVISSSGHRCFNESLAQWINDDQMTK
jgi:hypothetical protein